MLVTIFDVDSFHNVANILYCHRFLIFERGKINLSNRGLSEVPGLVLSQKKVKKLDLRRNKITKIRLLEKNTGSLNFGIITE